MPRHSAAIHTDSYSGLVDDAAAAFAEDPSYLVAMVRQAAGIIRKRAIWAARLDLRRAEAEAHEACSLQPAFVCPSRTPCGTGECLFASQELATLVVVSTGRTQRPQEGTPYSLEDVVRPLYEQRAGRKASFAVVPV